MVHSACFLTRDHKKSLKLTQLTRNMSLMRLAKDLLDAFFQSGVQQNSLIAGGLVHVETKTKYQN